MNKFIITFFVIGIVLYPSLVGAQGAGSAERPQVVPPTTAPSEPLPPAPLIEEEIVPSAASFSEVEETEVTPIEPINAPVWLLAFVGLAIILIIGIGWHIWRRGEISHITGTFRK